MIEPKDSLTLSHVVCALLLGGAVLVAPSWAADSAATGDAHPAARADAAVAWGLPVQDFIFGVRSPTTNVVELVLRNTGTGSHWVTAFPHVDERHSKCREFLVLRLLDSEGKAVPTNERAGLSGAPSTEIMAGQELRWQFDVREYLDVKTPGTYQLQARNDRMTVSASQYGGTNIVVESGTLTMAVDAAKVASTACGTGQSLTPTQLQAAEVARAWMVSMIIGSAEQTTTVDVPFSWGGTEVLSTREELEPRLKRGKNESAPSDLGLVYAVVETGSHAAAELKNHYRGTETNVMVTRVMIKGHDLVVFVRPGQTPKVVGFWE